MRPIPAVRCLSTLLWLALLSPVPVFAADSVTGTFTVNGRTLLLKNVYARLDMDPEDPARHYLVILVSDRPIAPSDRSIERLRGLASEGKIHAVRILWATGFDQIMATPYHGELEASGQRGRETPTIDLQAFDDRKVQAQIKSKMVGQAWHFNAVVNAVIEPGGAVEIEPAAASTEENGSLTAGDPMSLKRRLGQLGYEYNEEPFTHAVKDGAVEAVELFLQLGMSPNTPDSAGNHPMILAAMMCDRPPVEGRHEILAALLAAKGDVNAQDENRATPLIWAAQSCDAEIVRMLIEAGANVNAKAAGGGTPLLMAQALQREEIVALLLKAGAK